MPDPKICHTPYFRDQDSGSDWCTLVVTGADGQPVSCFTEIEAKNLLALFSWAKYVAGDPITATRIAKTESANCRACAGEQVFNRITMEEFQRRKKLDGD